MSNQKANGNIINRADKYKLTPKGKKLDPHKVELKAIKVFGVKEYRKELAKIFDCSLMTISHAFNGKAAYMLYAINKHLNLLIAEGKIKG